MIARRLTDPRDPGPASQPLLRDDPRRPIVQRHRGAAVTEGLEEPGQRDDLPAAEIHRAVELEPVDARADVRSHRLNRAERAPFSFDAPAFGDELPDGGRKPGHGDRVVLLRGLVIPLAPEPRFRQTRQRRLLGIDVAADQQPADRIERRRARAR